MDNELHDDDAPISLHEVCAVCGATYGEHSWRYDKCPDPEQADNSKPVYLATAFRSIRKPISED